MHLPSSLMKMEKAPLRVLGYRAIALATFVMWKSGSLNGSNMSR